MARMRMQALSTPVVFDHPHRDLSRRPFRLVGDSGEYTCDALVIATSIPRKLPGHSVRGSIQERSVSAAPPTASSQGPDVAVIGGNTAVEEHLS